MEQYAFDIIGLLYTGHRTRLHIMVYILRHRHTFKLEEPQDLSRFCRLFWLLSSGGRLNKKDGLTRYGDSHVKDKTS